MTPARLQVIEEIFHSALDQEPDRTDAFLDAAYEGDELLRGKLKRSSLPINEHAISLKSRLLVLQRGSLKIGRLICSLVT